MTIDIQQLAKEISKSIQFAWAPRWMSLKEASYYSGWGKQKLVELVDDGKITGFQDDELKTKPWVIDRDSIDKYRSRQAQLADGRVQDDENQKIAVDVLKGVDI